MDVCSSWLARRFHIVLGIGSCNVHAEYEVGSVQYIGVFANPPNAAAPQRWGLLCSATSALENASDWRCIATDEQFFGKNFFAGLGACTSTCAICVCGGKAKPQPNFALFKNTKIRHMRINRNYFHIFKKLSHS